jgi:hypothetical protein
MSMLKPIPMMNQGSCLGLARSRRVSLTENQISAAADRLADNALVLLACGLNPILRNLPLEGQQRQDGALAS